MATMEIKHSVWMAAIFIVALLAWDDWQVRKELDQLKQQQAMPIALTSPSQMSPSECPASPPGTVATPAALLAAPAPEPAPVKCNCNCVQDPNTVQIPPGTDLLGAIKIIQREQAKNEPGSAGMNPFGSTQ